MSSCILDKKICKHNLEDILNDIYKKLKGKYGNAKTASYIPILKNIDPEIFQISVYPVKGNKWGFPNKEVSVGDFKDNDGKKVQVTIQSVSKVFSLAKTIKVRNQKNKKKKTKKTGVDDIKELIGIEESFLGFNDPMAHEMLDGTQGVPFTINPYINAGAIAVVSFITPRKTKSTIAQIIDNLEDFSGSYVDKTKLSVATFNSEMAWIKNNRKLAFKIKKLSERFSKEKGNIRKFKYFQNNDDTLGVDDALRNYTAMCSLLVDSKMLANMTYTLANSGVNTKGKRVLTCNENRFILSTMIFGGMYNASGSWHEKIGIPMKSGVGGAIIAIIPGQMAISVVSPPLDKFGNSEIGGHVIQHLLNKLNYHSYGDCKTGQLVIPRLIKINSKKTKKKKNVDLSPEQNIKKIEKVLIKE